MAAEPSATDAPPPLWRRQLSEALAHLPAARRRGLRSFAPADGALLQPADPESPYTEGDFAAYRCEDCLDRFDLEVTAEDLGDIGPDRPQA